MNFSTKLFLSIILIACSILIGLSAQKITFYPNIRRYQRVYHLPSTTSFRHSRHNSRMTNNHFPQNDSPASFHNTYATSLPLQRSTHFDRHVPNSHHLPKIKSYGNHRDKKMAPSYFRNGNHHHITIPVPRNSVTRITVPLVRVHPAPVGRHQLQSHYPIATWSPHSRTFQNHITTVEQQHPYQPPLIKVPTKKHDYFVQFGSDHYPSVQRHHSPPSKLSYSAHHLTNNYNSHHRPVGNELIVNNNKAGSTRKNIFLQNGHSSTHHLRSSTLTPSRQINHHLVVAPTHQPKTYEDWRNSLGTSAFQSNPSRNHNLRQQLNVRLKNPTRSRYRQSKNNDLNNLPRTVTTSVATPAAEKKRTTVHIYLRHPQKHLVNSTTGTTKLPKPLAVPSNCIRCPSNQMIIIEKGKSCATVTVPPIKLCSWVSKRPGRLEMELGVGPKPGKSVKEGNYMMQFHLFKGGYKVKTCQFRINVKALRCPLIHSPANGAVHCTNNVLWGSTCNFNCDFGYALVGHSTTTCEGDKTAVSWTKPPPVCEEREIAAFSNPGCQVPDKPINGDVYCGSENLSNISEDNKIYPIGSFCHFTCNKGFIIPSHLTPYGYIICQGNKWNITQNIECHASHCQPPEEPENGFASCIQAQPEGWSERGDTLSTYFLSGTKCQYKCNDGFVIPTNQLNITHIECHAPFWNSSAMPKCHKKVFPTYHTDDCHNITLTVGEEYTNSSLLVPRFFSANQLPLKPVCSLNGSLINPGIYENHCEATDPELRTSTTCSYNITVKVPGCHPLPEIQNGIIVCTSVESDLHPISSECSYDCNSGYVIPTSMRDSRGRICLPSAKWNISSIPECKKRLVPKPQGDACSNVEIQTSNPSAEIISKPSFLTADGKAAEVTCTFLNVSHEGIYENTCEATDPELQTTASCKYQITVKGIEDSYTASSLKGHECGALKAPANGKIQCLSKGSKFHCSIQCNEGFSLPSSFTNLHENVVECDRYDGFWNFQTADETDLPDCLAELPMTTLQRSLKFKVGVSNCSDYISLMSLTKAIQNSIHSRTKENCDQIDCSDFSYVCGIDNTKNELMIEATLNAKMTYNASEHEGNEDVPDAEVLINKLQELIQKIIKEADFKNEIDSAGGDLWQDSFHFERFILTCPESGYVVDPDTLKCFECPKGTIEEDGKCNPCPGNHYQDVPGRTYCMPCPPETISKEGSRSKSDCQKVEHDLILPEANREQALTESTVFTTCDSHPCKNGGTCNIMLNTYSCICKNGYTGKQCETVICPENYCLNGGKCTSFTNNVVGCACLKSFSGPRCESYVGDPGVCSLNPCRNNGTCLLEADSYRCQCLSSYMGEHCQYELCDKRFKRWYCLNGGTCSKISDIPVCLCRTEYTGSRCQYKNEISIPEGS